MRVVRVVCGETAERGCGEKAVGREERDYIITFKKVKLARR
jgi:hypothetical protein